MKTKLLFLLMPALLFITALTLISMQIINPFLAPYAVLIYAFLQFVVITTYRIIE